MLAYAFYAAVGGFVAIAAFGHVLLLQATLPDLFGRPPEPAGTALQQAEPSAPPAQKLAA